MKKIVCILLGMSAVLSMGGCGTLGGKLLRDPEVQVAGFGLDEVSMREVAVRLKLNVKNPNSVPLKLGKVTYALNFAGEQVTQGEVKEGVNVPANGENTVEIPLRFAYNSVGNVLKGLFTQNFTRDYELKGTAQVGLFAIPFSKKGEVELDMPKQPK